MRRRPNPWIVIPAVVLGLIAGALAWVVTSVSCDLTDTLTGCVGWSTIVSLLTFGVVVLGTGLVLVLVYRSFAEWREKQERATKPDGEM
jgi:hypothetical protein